MHMRFQVLKIGEVFLRGTTYARIFRKIAFRTQLYMRVFQKLQINLLEAESRNTIIKNHKD